MSVPVQFASRQMYSRQRRKYSANNRAPARFALSPVYCSSPPGRSGAVFARVSTSLMGDTVLHALDKLA